MATEIANVDAASYARASRKFTSDLEAFHQARGTPFKRPPLLGGRTIDLYLLYKKVVSLGGLVAVTENRRWREVVKCFDLPPSCTNAAFSMRQHYLRFLEAYEQVNHFGHVDDDGGSKDDDSCDAGAPIPMEVVRQPEVVFRPAAPITERRSSSQGRAASSLSELHTLRLQLLSGLPNEVDIALNSLLILSHSCADQLFLSNVPDLLETLLAHGGVFCSGHLSAADCERLQACSDRMVSLWNQTVPNLDDGRVDEDDELENSECHCCAIVDSWATHRAQVITTTLFNLLQVEHNAVFLAKSPAFAQYLTLSLRCQVPAVQRLAMETLVDISEQYVLDKGSSVQRSQLQQVLFTMLLSSDKAVVRQGLRALSGICHCNRDEQLAELFPRRCLTRMFALLTAPHVDLIIGCLETLVSISALGNNMCTLLLDCQAALSTLVSLLTLDMETALPVEALQQIRLSSETVPPVVLQPTDTEGVATAWLRANYELSTGGMCSRNQIYNEYAMFCAVQLRQPLAVLQPPGFWTILARVFSSVQGVGLVLPGSRQIADMHLHGLSRRSPPGRLHFAVSATDAGQTSRSAVLPSNQPVVVQTQQLVMPGGAVVSVPSSLQFARPGVRMAARLPRPAAPTTPCPTTVAPSVSHQRADHPRATLSASSAPQQPSASWLQKQLLQSAQLAQSPSSPANKSGSSTPTPQQQPAKVSATTRSDAAHPTISNSSQARASGGQVFTPSKLLQPHLSGSSKGAPGVKSPLLASSLPASPALAPATTPTKPTPVSAPLVANAARCDSSSKSLAPRVTATNSTAVASPVISVTLASVTPVHISAPVSSVKSSSLPSPSATTTSAPAQSNSILSVSVLGQLSVPLPGAVAANQTRTSAPSELSPAPSPSSNSQPDSKALTSSGQSSESSRSPSPSNRSTLSPSSNPQPVSNALTSSGHLSESSRGPSSSIRSTPSPSSQPVSNAPTSSGQLSESSRGPSPSIRSTPSPSVVFSAGDISTAEQQLGSNPPPAAGQTCNGPLQGPLAVSQQSSAVRNGTLHATTADSSKTLASVAQSSNTLQAPLNGSFMSTGGKRSHSEEQEDDHCPAAKIDRITVSDDAAKRSILPSAAKECPTVKGKPDASSSFPQKSSSFTSLDNRIDNTEERDASIAAQSVKLSEAGQTVHNRPASLATTNGIGSEGSSSEVSPVTEMKRQSVLDAKRAGAGLLSTHLNGDLVNHLSSPQINSGGNSSNDTSPGSPMDVSLEDAFVPSPSSSVSKLIASDSKPVPGIESAVSMSTERVSASASPVLSVSPGSVVLECSKPVVDSKPSTNDEQLLVESNGAGRQRVEERPDSLGEGTSKTSPDNQFASSSIDTPVKSSDVLPSAVQHSHPCRWKTCLAGFDGVASLRKHVVENHLPRLGESTMCQWDGCPAVGKARQRQNLAHHLLEHVEGTVGIKKPAASTGLSKAGWASALERNEEYALSGTVHLTAALVLKNLAEHSALARSQLRRHEPLLVDIAMSTSEAAGVLAACLPLLDQGSPQIGSV